jgi:hypothetical protein
MFNQHPTLKSTLEFMTLTNRDMRLYLEIDKDTFWKLTKIAAEDQQSVEVWLENYLPILVDELTETK